MHQAKLVKKEYVLALSMSTRPALAASRILEEQLIPSERLVARFANAKSAILDVVSHQVLLSISISMMV